MFKLIFLIKPMHYWIEHLQYSCNWHPFFFLCSEVVNDNHYKLKLIKQVYFQKMTLLKYKIVPDPLYFSGIFWSFWGCKKVFQLPCCHHHFSCQIFLIMEELHCIFKNLLMCILDSLSLTEIIRVWKQVTNWQLNL